ncbi:MAG: hypothetical protein P1P84_07310 [Deferrisomatales bacterium]|nr:hypothetical protein [Deferrisomatales bacterium]
MQPEPALAKDPRVVKTLERRPWYEIEKRFYESRRYYFGSGLVGTCDLSVLASGPVTLEVKDPQGRVTSRDRREIPGSQYLQADFTTYPGDGLLDQGLTVPRNAPRGPYEISVFAQPGAKPDEPFVVEAFMKGYSVLLVEGLRIADLPRDPWVVEIRNLPPDIPTHLPTFHPVGKKLVLRLGANDFENRYGGEALPTVRLERGPVGMTFRPTERPDGGVIEWTPTVADVGPHELAVAAEDADGAVTRKQTELRVVLPEAERFEGYSRDGVVFLRWAPVLGAVAYNGHAQERVKVLAENLRATEFVDTGGKIGDTYLYSVYAVDRTGQTGMMTGFLRITVEGEREEDRP